MHACRQTNKQTNKQSWWRKIIKMEKENQMTKMKKKQPRRVYGGRFGTPSEFVKRLMAANAKAEAGGDKGEAGGAKAEAGGDKGEAGADKGEAGADKGEAGADKADTCHFHIAQAVFRASRARGDQDLCLLKIKD
jgi:hypothetical protein